MRCARFSTLHNMLPLRSRCLRTRRLWRPSILVIMLLSKLRALRLTRLFRPKRWNFEFVFGESTPVPFRVPVLPPLLPFWGRVPNERVVYRSQKCTRKPYSKSRGPWSSHFKAFFLTRQLKNAKNGSFSKKSVRSFGSKRTNCTNFSSSKGP